MNKFIKFLWSISIVAFVLAVALISIEYLTKGNVNAGSWLQLLTYPALGIINILMLLRAIDTTMYNLNKEYQLPSPKNISPTPLWKFLGFILLIAGCDILCIYLGEHIWCFRDAAIYVETTLICFSALFILTNKRPN